MREAAAVLSSHSLRYGEETIAYQVRRQPARTVNRISIHVDPNGDVLVDAPVMVSDTAIRVAVKKRARWIQGHVASFRQSGALALPREYVSGESFMYLGRRYRLKVIAVDPQAAGVRLWGGYIEIRVTAKQPGVVRAALEHWLRARAKIVLGDRLEAVCSRLRWVHGTPNTRFQAMKVQWGSCSPQGRLTLNPFLVKAPKECIDYVLLHELCHIQEHNHSARFYRLLDRHLPEWRLRKLRLDNLADQILNR